MKKFMLAVLLLATTLLSFGQTSEPVRIKNQEIVDLLNMSAEFNGGLTIEDLNHPWMLQVGQTATFQLRDGSKLQFVAQKGDNFWVLGKRALKYQQENPGNPIVAPDTTPVKEEGNAGVSPVITEEKSGLAPIWWFLIVATLAVLFSWLIFGRKKTKKEKPAEQVSATQEFLPLVPGGVSDAQGPAYMQQVAARKRLTIVGPTENVLLSTKEGKKIKMDFVGCQDEREFKDEPFRRALAIRNQGDTPQYAYYQQVCGNDATILNPDDITVVVCENQPQELIQANQQAGTPMQPATQQSQEQVKAEQSVLPLTGSSIMDVLKDATEKVMEKDNGKLVFTAPGVHLEVEFSKSILVASNGQTKELAQPAHQQQS